MKYLEKLDKSVDRLIATGNKAELVITELLAVVDELKKKNDESEKKIGSLLEQIRLLKSYSVADRDLLKDYRTGKRKD